jgi:hypothetical protein
MGKLMAICERFYCIMWISNSRVIATCRLCGKTVDILKHTDCGHGKEIHKIIKQ